ncbi:CBS domain-containing protein [Streptomyces sp. 549]|uniref:CBS domain-containing protein n=1 Tax=Streptomyces sp. 549 TaxID=3049076 RepID=UPI0024C3FB4E|nr:CBS domain-containing protein [Streptomyces sp. 549]MDK1472239.1 CBS domain-containing protein [Streptomyces sp. 549]
MKHRLIASVMTRDVVAVERGTPLKEAADLLARHRVSGLPVVDEDEQVLGVVSLTDLTLRQAGQGIDPPAGWVARLSRGARRDHALRAKAGARTAGELMSSPAVTVGPRQTVVDAARLMAAHNVERLPVIDEEGRLTGIVTRRDLLGVFLRSDEEIRREVIDEVLVRALWLPPQYLRVDVREGVVTLTGKLPRRSEIRIAERLTERVDGVAGVIAELGYEEDDSHLQPTERALHGIAEEWMRKL